MKKLLGVGRVKNLAEENDNFIIPDYNYAYQPTERSIEFFNWDKAMFGDEGYPTPKTHYMAIDMFLNAGRDAQAICHRDFAKTTILVKKFIIYIACKMELPGFGLPQNTCVFAATNTQAVEIVESIGLMVSINPKLNSILKPAIKPNGKQVSAKTSHICWELPNGKWFHIQAKGAGDSMRGTQKTLENGKSVRLQALFFDDILPDEILKSEKARETNKTWFFGSIGPAVETGFNRRFLVGTPMVEDDVINTVAKGRTYATIKFPVAQDYPGPDAVSAWPERFTLEEIEKRRIELTDADEEAAFFREYMLEIADKSQRVFRDEDWKGYKLKDMLKIPNWLDTLNIYTTMDLAVSSKEKNAKTSIQTIGVDPLGQRFLLDIDSGRFNPREVIDKIFEHHKKWMFQVIKAEKIGMQMVFETFLREEQVKRGVYFAIEYLKANSIKSKHTRIVSLEPQFKKGIWHIPIDTKKEEIKALKHQYKGYLKTGASTAVVDDLDCLANFNDEDFVYIPEKPLTKEEREALVHNNRTIYGEDE